MKVMEGIFAYFQKNEQSGNDGSKAARARVRCESLFPVHIMLIGAKNES